MPDSTGGSLTFAGLAASLEQLHLRDFDDGIAAALGEPAQMLSSKLIPEIRASRTWACFAALRRARRQHPADPLEDLGQRLVEQAARLTDAASLPGTAERLGELGEQIRAVTANRTLRALWYGAGTARTALDASPSLGARRRRFERTSRLSSSLDDAADAASRVVALAALLAETSRRRERAQRWFDAVRGEGELSVAAPPDVSIVVVSYDDPRLVASCATVVGSVPAGATWELLIANNGPPSRELSRCADADGRIRVVEIGANRGFGEACNIASELACAGHLVFLNADVVVADGWLSALLDAYVSDESIGVLGATLVSPDGTVQEAGCYVDAAGHVWQNCRGSSLADLQSRPAVRTDHVSAACTLISRELFSALGGFDFRYFPAYCEDLDLCLKARSSGLAVAYSEALRVLHVEHGGDSSDAKMGSIQTMVARNRVELIRKWGLAETVEAKERFDGFDGIEPSTRDAVSSRRRVGGVHPQPPRKTRIAVRTSIDLAPGDGAAGLVRAAVRLAGDDGRVSVVTPGPWSRLRLYALAEAAGFAPGEAEARVELLCEREATGAEAFDSVYEYDAGSLRRLR